MKTNNVTIETRQNGRKRVLLNTGEGLTEQAHKDECDMNLILREYSRTGIIRHTRKHEGRYDDIPAMDFRQAMELVAEARDSFQELPADMRKRFGNDPYAFLGYVQDPNNKAELQKLGMLKGNDGLDRNGKPTQAPVPDPAPAPEPSGE